MTVPNTSHHLFIVIQKRTIDVGPHNYLSVMYMHSRQLRFFSTDALRYLCGILFCSSAVALACTWAAT